MTSKRQAWMAMTALCLVYVFLRTVQHVWNRDWMSLSQAGLVLVIVFLAYELGLFRAFDAWLDREEDD